MRMDGVMTSQMELALQVKLGDLHIAHGHADIFMSQQLHQCRKADSEAEHFCSKGVPELVAGDMGASGALRSLI